MYRRRYRGRRERPVDLRGGLHSLAPLYEAYYSLRPPIEEPSELQRREFAFQYIGAESYTRHISFSTYEEMLDHLAERPPLHAYYSIAVYELPEARNMEEKGFIRASLFFDIDVDHFPGCQGPLPGDECLLEGLRAAARLEAMARRDLGAENVITYYTGNRGFHVIVECNEDCEKMGREERREIAWYVAAEALDLDILFPNVRSRSLQPATPSDSDPGWRGWVARAIPGGRPGLVDTLGPGWREEIYSRIEELRVPIDMQVTQDTSRLSRLRGTLNGKASLLVMRVGEGWRPDYRLLSPFNGSVEARCLEDLEGRVVGFNLDFKKGEEVELPAQVGILLFTKGLCEVLGGEVVVRAGPGWRPV